MRVVPRRAQDARPGFLRSSEERRRSADRRSSEPLIATMKRGKPTPARVWSVDKALRQWAGARSGCRRHSARLQGLSRLLRVEVTLRRRHRISHTNSAEALKFETTISSAQAIV